MVILVTGAAGQLGQALEFVSSKYPQAEFRFTDSKTLDVTNYESVGNHFQQIKPDFCINAAAYTAVDKAESEPEKAQAINVDGAKNLAQVCCEYNTTLIHVSTDFVFDGKSDKPYTEQDIPNPKSVYGQTKLDGEEAIAENWHKHVIIRTSWLYSQFGNNFMKTMLRLASERDSLSIVSDQIGTPTNAVDLAEAIIEIINILNTNNQIPTHTSHPFYGLYHFSNEGQCSWFDFAKKIFEINKVAIAIHPIPTSAYPTPAERPKYSVLDKAKIKTRFGIAIAHWQEAIQPQST